MGKTSALKKAPPDHYEAEKRLRDFCSVAGSELNALLAAISGELEYGLEHANLAVRERSVRHAIGDLERAENTVRNLRYLSDFARLDVCLTDVSQLVLDSVEVVEREFAAHEIKFDVGVESNVYAVVDAGALHQALLNLFWLGFWRLSGGGIISVSLEVTTQELAIKVQMSFPKGTSVPSEPHGEEQRHLGLEVSQVLIETHGGKFQLVSESRSEMEFLLTIPLQSQTPQTLAFPEKRRHRRVRVKLPVEVCFDQKQRLTGNLTTLSVGGCFVALGRDGLDVLPQKGMPLSLKIRYQGRSTAEVKKAQVASIVQSGLHFGVGVEFLEMDVKTAKILAALVRGHSG